MDPEYVNRKITAKTKAVMAVHLYGQACDMKSLQKLCKDNNLFLIEDCAEAIGTRYEDSHVGTFGDIATFSFFGNKTITTGEGGMVVTNDNTLYDRSVHFKGQGLAKHRQYWHDVIGYNYRMTNICAAIGLAQLEQIETFVNQKKQVANWYKKYLSSRVEFHQEAKGTYHSYWMCSILVPQAAHRESLREHMALAGIETRPLFYPAHTMPMYSSRFQKHSVAEDLGWRGINLPSYPSLTEENVSWICSVISSFFDK
jgi:perosamine synthetase